MHLSKANLTIASVASSDKTEADLNQLRVEPDGATAASNGRAILAVSPVEEVPRAFPDLDLEDVHEDGIGVPIDVVSETIKNLPKGKHSVSLGFAAVTGCEHETGGKVELTTVNLTMRKKLEAVTQRKRFPRWQGVMRDARAQATRGRVCVNRKDMISLLQAMESACPDPDGACFIEFGEQDDSLILRSVSQDTGQRALGLIRPLDTQGDWLPLSKWEKTTLGRSAKRKKRNEDR